MENSVQAGSHKLLIQGRKFAELTGIKEVVSFDEKEVVLNTTIGVLMIRGNDLFVKRLTVEKGEVDLEGQIDSFIYVDKAGKGGEKESIVKRLFR